MAADRPIAAKHSRAPIKRSATNKLLYMKHNYIAYKSKFI